MDNRSKIMLCALQLFAWRGFDTVSVQEIVEAAGITKPTLYHYFGSKTGLLDVILGENFAPLFDRLEKSAAYHGDLPLTLNQTTSVYFQFAKEHKQFYRMALSMWFSPQNSVSFQAVNRLNERQHLILEELFRQAAQDHGNMKGRQRAYAATFLGMLNTYISLSLNGNISLDDERVYQAVHQFMHGIFS